MNKRQLLRRCGLATLALFAMNISGLLAQTEQFEGFTKTPGGLYYKIEKPVKKGRQPQLNEILSLDIKYAYKDSMLYDSKETGEPALLMSTEPEYGSDVMHGINMLHIDEAGIFKTPADSFFLKVAQMDVPSFIEPGSYITFYITITKIQTKEELEAQRAREAEEAKANETKLIKSFLKKEKLKDAEPNDSGVYVIIQSEGTGASPEKGDKVELHYTGYLLNGEKFDSSLDRGTPFSYEFDMGQVIPGFDAAVEKMKVGSKAMVIIPSDQAYGANPPPGGVIKAYSTLRFDLELISVKGSSTEE